VSDYRLPITDHQLIYGLKPWLSAFAFAPSPCTILHRYGGISCCYSGKFNALIFLLCCSPRFFLQVLSNLANDYGDSVNGADHAERSGPKRSVQSGIISLQQMKRAVAFLCCPLPGQWHFVVVGIVWLGCKAFFFFFGLGVLSILAAITYTVGKKPYGYAGLGDLSVLIFLDGRSDGVRSICLPGAYRGLKFSLRSRAACSP